MNRAELSGSRTLALIYWLLEGVDLSGGTWWRQNSGDHPWLRSIVGWAELSGGRTLASIHWLLDRVELSGGQNSGDHPWLRSFGCWKGRSLVLAEHSNGDGGSSPAYVWPAPFFQFVQWKANILQLFFLRSFFSL